MERIYSHTEPRGYNYSRVTDLEDSQEWTSLASDINDLERAKMRKLMNRRSMPEPQQTSLIYVDDYDAGLTNDKKSINDHYFLPIGSGSVDESVDSWNWGREGDYNSDRKYFKNNNYENYDYNRPDVANNRRNTYHDNSQRDGIHNDKVRRLQPEETAYRGSRERLHEIFRRNRDLRREFFATKPQAIPEPIKNDSVEFKEDRVDTGNGYGSVETLGSHSNHSDISNQNNRTTENSSRASQNSRASDADNNIAKIVHHKEVKDLKFATRVDQTPTLREFGGSLRDKKEERYYDSSIPSKTESVLSPLSLEVSEYNGNPSKELTSPGFEGIMSPPPPPLPSSKPPPTSGHRLLISGASSPTSITTNPPDPPERRNYDENNTESEGLRMLNRFEACIENRKQSPLTVNHANEKSDLKLSKKSYTSMPDLSRGMISRVVVNDSKIDLNLNDHKNVQFTQVRPFMNYVEEPEEIYATRVDLLTDSKLSDRRLGVPPPLDLSKVAEALRLETVRHDQRVLRDYTVERTPLQAEVVKCKVKVLDGNRKESTIERNSGRQRVEAALKTATNLLDSRKHSRPEAPSDKNTGSTSKYRSSVIVWCDGNDTVENESKCRPISTRKSTLEHRKSTGSLLPVTGNVFPSVYAPIPYSQYIHTLN